MKPLCFVWKQIGLQQGRKTSFKIFFVLFCMLCTITIDIYLHGLSVVIMVFFSKNSLKTADLSFFSVFWNHNTWHYVTHCEGT